MCKIQEENLFENWLTIVNDKSEHTHHFLNHLKCVLGLMHISHFWSCVYHVATQIVISHGNSLKMWKTAWLCYSTLENHRSVG